MKGNTMKQPKTALPCSLCARSLDLRADKNGKPYFVCEPCGTQFFVRGTYGRERLADILRNPISSESLKKKESRSAAMARSEIGFDLKQMQSYIETFCSDQLVIPDPPYEADNAISFPTWSGEVFDRILRAIDRV
jgi:hypothetical protein